MKHEKHQGHHATHGHAHTKHVGMAEHHEMHHEGHHKGGHEEHGHKHHAAHKGFEHHSPHHHENAKSHHDGKKHGGEHYNPVEHGYGFGRHHDAGTGHGASIAGNSGPHTNDDKQHWIAGAIKHPGSFSKDAKKHHETTHEFAEKEKDKGGKMGKKADLALTLENMHGGHKAHAERHGGAHGHHIAGGEHGPHEHGSGKAGHHPPVAHQEPHRFKGHNTPGTHGFGHGVDRRDGHHRMSGHAGAHRIGHRE